MNNSSKIDIYQTTFTVPRRSTILLKTRSMARFARFHGRNNSAINLLCFGTLRSNRTRESIRRTTNSSGNLHRIQSIRRIFIRANNKDALPNRFCSPIYVFNVSTRTNGSFHTTTITLVTINRRARRFSFYHIHFFLHTIFAFFYTASISPFCFFVFGSFCYRRLVPMENNTPVTFCNRENVHMSTKTSNSTVFKSPINLNTRITRRLRNRISMKTKSSIAHRIRTRTFKGSNAGRRRNKCML